MCFPSIAGVRERTVTMRHSYTWRAYPRELQTELISCRKHGFNLSHDGVAAVRRSDHSLISCFRSQGAGHIVGPTQRSEPLRVVR